MGYSFISHQSVSMHCLFCFLLFLSVGIFSFSHSNHSICLHSIILCFTFSVTIFVSALRKSVARWCNKPGRRKSLLYWFIQLTTPHLKYAEIVNLWFHFQKAREHWDTGKLRANFYCITFKMSVHLVWMDTEMF